LRYFNNGIEDPRPVSKIDVEYGKQCTTERYCLMLATYEPRKGHAYLLQAFKIVVEEFPDVRLQIYGYGDPHEKQRVLVEVQRLELENNVSLNEFAPDTAALIANASVLVVPSQAYESFGLTIIEAMAFSTPVVTTDVGGMPEVLADSHAGYVCSKDDPPAFAEAIKKILGDSNLASELGKNGRLAFEQRFTARTMAENYRGLMK
jgi:glycosyltransferase involved in cell wall biosynthesis